MPELTQISPLNYVNVGTKGTFKKTGDYHTTAENIDELFEHLQQTNAQKLVIHFHGGLVPEREGIEVAKKMIPVYEKANAHPVTFVWETGFMETLVRNLGMIHETSLFREILKYVIKAAGKKLGVDVGGKGVGLVSNAEIEAELQKDIPFANFQEGGRGAGPAEDLSDEELKRELRADLDAMTNSGYDLDPYIPEDIEDVELFDKEKLAELKAEKGGAKGLNPKIIISLAKIAYRIVKRFIKKRDHGFYPTVIEEIVREYYIANFGAWIWSGMKEVAEDMWNPNTGLDGDKRHAGTYFLEKLKKHQQEFPGFIVDLVGHSAGSIAICKMFHAIGKRHPGIKIRKVAFLAPACRIDLFCSEIVSNPQRFTEFRMYTMNDDVESIDALVKGIYTRSLLYLISGILEEDHGDTLIAGLHRHIRGQAPYDDAEALATSVFVLANGHNRLILSETLDGAGDGMNCRSRRHGDFDDDEPTRESLSFYLS